MLEEQFQNGKYKNTCSVEVSLFGSGELVLGFSGDFSAAASSISFLYGVYLVRKTAWSVNCTISVVIRFAALQTYCRCWSVSKLPVMMVIYDGDDGDI